MSLSRHATRLRGLGDSLREGEPCYRLKPHPARTMRAIQFSTRRANQPNRTVLIHSMCLLLDLYNLANPLHLCLKHNRECNRMFTDHLYTKRHNPASREGSLYFGEIKYRNHLTLLDPVWYNRSQLHIPYQER